MKTITRRSFLGQCATLAAAATVPAFIRASDKSGTGLPVVGSGEHTY